MSYWKVIRWEFVLILDFLGIVGDGSINKVERIEVFNLYSIFYFILFDVELV